MQHKIQIIPPSNALVWWRTSQANLADSDRVAGLLMVAGLLIPPRKRRLTCRVRIAVLQKLMEGTGERWHRVERNVSPLDLEPRQLGQWAPPPGWDEWLNKTQ